MSLIEVMVASGIMGIGMVALLQNFTNLQSGIKGAQQSFEGGSVEKQIRTLLSDQTTCTNELIPSGPFDVEFPLTQIGSFVVNQNAPLSENSLFLTGLSLGNFLPYESAGDELANANRGTLELRISLTKSRPTPGGPVIERYVLLDVERNPSDGTLLNCRSTLFLGQSLWSRVRQTQHIFTSGLFDYRPVVIGPLDAQKSDLADPSALHIINHNGQAGLRLSGLGGVGRPHAGLILSSSLEGLAPDKTMWGLLFRSESPAAFASGKDFNIQSRYARGNANDWSVALTVDSQMAPKYTAPEPQGMVGIFSTVIPCATPIYDGDSGNPSALLHVQESTLRTDPACPLAANAAARGRGRVLISGDGPPDPAPSPIHSGFYLGQTIFNTSGTPQTPAPSVYNQAWTFARKRLNQNSPDAAFQGDFLIGLRSRYRPQMMEPWNFLSIDQSAGRVTFGNNLHLDDLLIDSSYDRTDGHGGISRFGRLYFTGWRMPRPLTDSSPYASLQLRSRPVNSPTVNLRSWFIEHNVYRPPIDTQEGGQLVIGYTNATGIKKEYLKIFRQTLDNYVDPSSPTDREYSSTMTIGEGDQDDSTPLGPLSNPAFTPPTHNENNHRLHVVGAICATSTIDNFGPSDERLKNILSPLEVDPEEYQGLKPQTFRYLGRHDDGRDHVGVTAQSLMKVFPELVDQDSSPMRIRRHELVALQVAALQKTHSHCEAQMEEVSSLEAELQDVDELINSIEGRSP